MLVRESRRTELIQRVHSCDLCVDSVRVGAVPVRRENHDAGNLLISDELVDPLTLAVIPVPRVL